MKGMSDEVALAVRRLADSLDDDNAIALRLAGESILIPSDAHIRAEYESGEVKKELVIRVTWGRSAGIPELILRHPSQVSDSDGHLYDVLVYGAMLVGGTWEGWIEFLPVSSTLPTLRTGRETTQPNRAALLYWATGLEPIYLAGAFDRAS